MTSAGVRAAVSPEELRAAIPAFRELSSRIIARLAAALIERRYPRGAVIFRAGDAADALYLVLSGHVRVARETEERIRTLHSEGPGGVLCEIPVFGGGPNPATATAAEPTRCAKIPVAAVERLLLDEPEFARFALRRTAARARVLLQHIDDLTIRTIASRVAEYFRHRARTAKRGEFTLGMSQASLAEELGTAREVVVRAIAKLCAAGVVRRTGRARFAMDMADRRNSLPVR